MTPRRRTHGPGSPETLNGHRPGRCQDMTTNRSSDLLLTSAAPAIWGSTYVVTTLMLPPGIP